MAPKELYFTTPPIDPNTKILFVSDGSFIEYTGMNTWQGKGQFGNKPVHETTLDLFSLKPY